MKNVAVAAHQGGAKLAAHNDVSGDAVTMGPLPKGGTSLVTINADSIAAEMMNPLLKDDAKIQSIVVIPDSSAVSVKAVDQDLKFTVSEEDVEAWSSCFVGHVRDIGDEGLMQSKFHAEGCYSLTFVPLGGTRLDVARVLVKANSMENFNVVVSAILNDTSFSIIINEEPFFNVLDVSSVYGACEEGRRMIEKDFILDFGNSFE
ncbi:hypothetical protein RIF29_29285 [Crotalaria pallida]|uniref:Uncharacterized protein n=1 Tax=Crotalaria pallida TaxID=3830 RepID=A0AAN9EEJ3_CROPI